jgi:hypothetical protein
MFERANSVFLGFDLRYVGVVYYWYSKQRRLNDHSPDLFPNKSFSIVSFDFLNKWF